MATRKKKPPAMPKDPFLGATEIPALASYVRHRRCILFVGAGLSFGAGYPGWKDLMVRLVGKTFPYVGPEPSKELQDLVERGKFTEVADQCRQILGRAGFARLLRAELDRDVEPPATHRSIVRTPYAGIVTTNFDTLLENAYARWGDFGVPRAPTGAELAQHGTLLLDGAFFILKAHGSIHDEASLVFTSEDYRRITHENPAFQAMMSALLLSHAVLFVGYSLNDPNFRLLLDSQLATFRANMPPRYALMENVGPTERQILRRTAGIEVISFAKGDFAQVGRLLEHLADESNPAPPKVKTKQPACTLLRERPREDVFVVQLQPRGPNVDCQWFRTVSTDLRGINVPPQRQYAQTGVLSNWLELRKLLPDAVHAWQKPDALVTAGQLLAQAISGVVKVFPEIDPAHTSIVLDIAPELAALPWEWTAVAESMLCYDLPVYRTFAELSEASRGRPMPGQPLRVLVIADTMADVELLKYRMPLADARNEALDIEKLFRRHKHQVRVLIGKDARYDTVRDEITNGRYDVVHFAGHGWFDDRGTNLYLHDGRVSAAELVTLLLLRPPALLFAGTHYSGWVPAFTEAFPVEFPASGSYEDFYRTLRGPRPGLERAAARAGVGAFVGCIGSPSDDGARAVAVGFYERLLAGKSVARALWEARRLTHVLRKDLTPLYFSASGYGDLRLAAPPRSAKARAKKSVK